MTDSSGSAADEFLAILNQLREATLAVSYTTLVREAGARQEQLTINSKRLSDWFNGKTVPDDPEVVRFLVGYLQPRAVDTAGYQERPLKWWLSLHQRAKEERQERRDDGGRLVSPRRLGRPIRECDPLALEVHQAIQMPGASTVSALPAYVPRAHDVRMRELVNEMIDDGQSRLIMLVGRSSTGKTRAGWELAQYLESQRPGRWRLWHPYDPTRPQAAVADLAKTGPDTIVWLNEAQHYLMPADPGRGEQIAAGLRTLLQDPGRRPVLVLATLWPNYWNTLTTRPAAGDRDIYGQARELLAAGTAVTLTDTFTPAEIAGLSGPGVDARLRYAAEHAEGGRIIQYLAGAPALEDRYRTAPPSARAILRVAMDARRIGHPLALPHALLEQAGPGYLDDHDWDTVGDDWLESALAYTAQPCNGAHGALIRIRARPGEPPLPGGQPCYRLSDYLEQLGRTERAAVYPPDSLWRALTTTVTDPDLLHNLGEQAEQRGRYQHAIWFYRRAVDRGDPNALWDLARLRERSGDRAGAEALYRQIVDESAPGALWDLARLRERSGDRAGAETLYRQAADHGNTDALAALVSCRCDAEDLAGAAAFAEKAAERGDASVLRWLAGWWEERIDSGRWNAVARAEALYQRAADHGDRVAPRRLAQRRRLAGDHAGAEILYRQAAKLGDPIALGELVRGRLRAGDIAGAETLAVQAAGGLVLDPLVGLARRREEAGDHAGAESLYQQAIDRGGDIALRELIRQRKFFDWKGAQALVMQAADRGDPEILAELAQRREEAGDHAGAEALALQAADHGNTTKLVELAIQRAGAGDTAGADALYRQAVDRGDNTAPRLLFWPRARAGDSAGAATMAVEAVNRGNPGALYDLSCLQMWIGNAASIDRIKRFGLTGPGEVAEALDFDA